MPTITETQAGQLLQFHNLKNGRPGQAAIDAYERDGVVGLKAAFSPEWVNQGRRAVAAALRSKSRSEQHESYTRNGEKGAFYFDTFLWKRLPSFNNFTFNSPAASLARDIMRSDSLLLYFDMAIVKEPGASATTPWHYDEAYWPVSGTQVCNVWIALDHVPMETALQFVPGSHRLDTNYQAVDFFSKRSKKGHTLPPPPQ